MATKKNADATKVVELTDDELRALEKSSPVENEVINEQGEPDGFPIFTVTINGEEIELEDRFRGDKKPAALMMIGLPQYAQKYLPGLLEQIIGQEQIITILDAGADVDEMGSVVQSWAEARGVGND